MKVLITGSSGFIGTTACEAFHKDYEVVGVDKRPPKENFEGVKYYQANILSLPEMFRVFVRETPEVVLHFAAQARVEPSYKLPIQTYRDNVEGTIALLDLSSKLSGVQRFVYASSEIVYGEADRYPTREVDHFRPTSPYAASKAAADLLVQQACWSGLKTVVLRSGMGFGPRSPPEQVITKFILRTLEDKPLLFPAGNLKHPTRDVNYVGNFIEGVRLVLEKPDVTGVFNMGSGRELSILEIAEKVIETVGKGHIEFTDKFKYRYGETGMRTWLDISKARRILGYEAKISFEEGLKITADWLQKNRDYWK